MNADIARQVARNPAPHSRAVLALALDLLLREVEAGEARLDEDQRLRTLGGRPPGYTDSTGGPSLHLPPIACHHEQGIDFDKARESANGATS